MKSNYTHRIVATALACIVSPFAQAGEAASLLVGAETYNLKFSVYSDPGCVVDQQVLKVLVDRQFGKAPKLRAVAEEAIPDIILNLTIDITSLPPAVQPAELCMYNVNARAIHPMYGKLRYSDKARVIQALTFNKSLFSVIVPSKVQTAVENQSVKVLGLFLDEYAIGNPFP